MTGVVTGRLQGGGGGLAGVRTPQRPGPGPTPRELLGALDVEVRRGVEGLLAGDHRSSSVGAGTELARVRPYAPGDDVRLLDPSATARTGEPHVRAHVAERALTTWLALDASPSMGFGTADRRKADVAEGVALAFGHLATRGANRLGIVTFGEREPRTLPPRGGRPGTLGLLATLRRENGREAEGESEEPVGATSPGEALGGISRLSRRGALVVVVSDFRGPRDWLRPLLALAARHNVLAVEVQDPREGELPDVGDVVFVDPETGRQLRVDTASRRLRERFAAEAAREREELAREILRTGADHVVLSTKGDWLRALTAFLRRRSSVRRSPHASVRGAYTEGAGR